MSGVIVLASRNQGKIREFGVLLRSFGLEALGLDAFPQIGEIAETGASFEENARLKALEVSGITKLTALADDSGLEVAALDGEPGIFSARYSPEGTDAANNARLLERLKDVPSARRQARFCCAIAACHPEGGWVTVTGRWEGVIIENPRGTNGFGYDPLFFDPLLGRTAAELSPEEKNERSHRGQAVRKLLAIWPDFMKM